MDGSWLLTAWIVLFLIILAAWPVARNWDRICCTVIYRYNLPMFPEAAAIANLIAKQPEQWRSTGGEFRHPDIGSVSIDNGVRGIKILTKVGTWHPNGIERRIIRDAVDWRLGQYIKETVAETLKQKLLEDGTKNSLSEPDRSSMYSRSHPLNSTTQN